MARGQDTSRHPGRIVGPDSSLHKQIAAETQTQKYLFGTTVGTQDSGERTLKRPAPAGGMLTMPTGGEAGPGYSRPVFHGAHPNAIKLAQMRENHADAMAGLMQPAPTNDRKVEGLVDVGMGRLSDGVERPVQSWVDENIRVK